MRRLITILMAIVLAVGMTACGSGSSAKDLVKVGDATINESQLDQYLELYAYTQGMDLTQIPDEKSMKYIKSLLLEDMISMEAMKQHFSGKEDKVLPDTIDADLENFIKDSKDNEEVAAFIKKNKISDEALKSFYLNQYYTNAYFDEIAAGMSTLEEDAKAYYDKNKENYKVDEVTASHILVKDEALAKEILQRLKNGEKFEDLAAKYSIDTATKDKGGSLGTFGKGQMVTEFETAAFALEPGELSNIVKTKYGYHIIKVTAKNQGYKSYDEVKETIKAELVSQVSEEKIEKLRDKIGVEYLTKEYTGETAE